MMNTDIEEIIRLLFIIKTLAHKQNLTDFENAIDECILYSCNNFSLNTPSIN